MDPKTSVLTFVSIVGLGVWGWSAWQLLRATKLRSGARFVYAFGGFPILAALFGLESWAGLIYAPSLLGWLGEMSSVRLPLHLEALIVVPILLPLPILGFLVWTRAIEKLEHRLTNHGAR